MTNEQIAEWVDPEKTATIWKFGMAACPKCGCNETQLVTLEDTLVGIRCRHCGTEFSPESLPSLCPDFLHDDGAAAKWVLPVLREAGYAIDIYPHMVNIYKRSPMKPIAQDKALSAALCAALERIKG